MSELLKNPRETEKVQEELRRVFDENGDVDESESHKLTYLYSLLGCCQRSSETAPSFTVTYSKRKQRKMCRWWLHQFNGNDFEYIPFGAGRSICPGISFGVANVEFFLAQLLFHFDWKLPNGTKEKGIDVTEVFGATVARKHDLFF
uniref:Cytochrome P450 n=1 Tax=Kalanchoe fedtschenkoi TaxID=63787 RepID=A0A7N0UAW5_KALFE